MFSLNIRSIYKNLCTSTINDPHPGKPNNSTFAETAQKFTDRD